MPSSVRPKGSGGGSRAPPVTPMSERQQMALLMQMTSSSNEGGSRSPSSNCFRFKECNERGETPLHLAAIKGDVEQVTKLLAHRADPNVTDFAGWTPLHEACNRGWYEVAFRLVQSGANVNAKGFQNDTPLHDAAVNGHLKLVKLLVERGADIHAKNLKGKTSLDVAPQAVKPYLLNVNLPLPETAVSSRLQPRSSRDDKKATADSSKQKGSTGDTMDAKTATTTTEDVYEFKSVKEGDSSLDHKGVADALDADVDATDPLSITTSQADEPTAGTTAKRNISELSEPGEDSTAGNEEETRKKKRKDDTAKEGKSTAQRNTSQTKGQSGKQSGGNQNKSGPLGSVKASADKKSPCSSPKPASTDAETEEGKTDLKVPPLKIVIPQTTSNEQDSCAGRNGKNSSQRTHHALPYVVPSSNSNDSSEKESTPGSSSPGTTGRGDERKDSTSAGPFEERGGSSHQRVLRSSHRSGTTQATDRGSNNSSPQLQRSHSPSPTASPAAPPMNQVDPPGSSAASTNVTSKSSDSQAQQNNITETTHSSVSAGASNAAPVELHPRKRKLKQNKEQPASQQEAQEVPSEAQIHSNEQSTTNCYHMYMNIRKEINKRRRNLFIIPPKPWPEYSDFLMKKQDYILAYRKPPQLNIVYPQNLPPQMKELFAEQEKDRYKLTNQHRVERERLILTKEQEIQRVHIKSARVMAHQPLPLSVCTILKDEEVYNLASPREDDERDRTARARGVGRQFLKWTEEVTEKWEKNKGYMVMRHHNEAESLHAVQKMDWEWKMRELNLCDRKTTPKIDETHVPLVYVHDDRTP